MNRWSISNNISGKTISEVVELYHADFGWVIHPVERSSKGGKKPLTRGWKKLESGFLTKSGWQFQNGSFLGFSSEKGIPVISTENQISWQKIFQILLVNLHNY